MNQETTTQEDKKLEKKRLKTIAKEKKAELERLELEEREAQLLLKRQRQAAKKEIEALNQAGQYGTQSEPRKSLSTFFRNQNKLDISVVTILDRKAAILIRICTTIISGLVVFHDYIDTNVDQGHLISIVLMIGLMITLVLAILATKPFTSMMRKIRDKEISPKYADRESNLFMGVQPACSLEEYEVAMRKVINSQDLQLGNQIRAAYILSKNNNFKSQLVDWAFNIFLFSFLATGLIYIVAKFF